MSPPLTPQAARRRFLGSMIGASDPRLFRSTETSRGSSPGPPEPQSRPGRRLHRRRSAGGPRAAITPAHLGLDDARKEAQGDEKLHRGRRPLPCAGPRDPRAHADLSPRRGRPGPSGPGNGGRPGRRPKGTVPGGRETPGSEVSTPVQRRRTLSPAPGSCE